MINVHELRDGDRIVSSEAPDHAPYWRATTGRVHRVEGVSLVWRGPHASPRAPRVIIHVRCRSMWQPKVNGLTASTDGDRCAKCFGASS